MFLSGVLFVLFLAGCWLYCLTDAALTPASQFPWLSKRAWIAVIAVTFILGAVAWVVARRLNRPRRARYLLLAADAIARHPASRGKLSRVSPLGPDDDQEFMQMLDRLISGSSDSSELSTLPVVAAAACDSSDTAQVTVQALAQAPRRAVSSRRRRSACR